ncbi:MAG: hypothetical protein MJA84_14910 [Firmicutes bacterium]|nr:hypothetical protein [Bacillota bacterium]
MGPRIVEAYVGEYASGKSEVAVNRALELAGYGRKVTLVDLDIVEPFYTLRPIKKELEQKGIAVLAWETKDTVGLGETGNVLRAENRWALRRDGDIILDIGYGAEGAKTLNLLEDAVTDPDLRVYAVINIARPMTGTAPEILEYVRELGRVDGLVNNSHLGDDTDVEIVREGARLVAAVAGELGVNVVATTAVVNVAEQIGPEDGFGNPVRKLVRYMPRTFW